MPVSSCCQARSGGRFYAILLIALLSSLAMLSLLVPVFTVQAGFTPTPVPPTATNTPQPSSTPTPTATAVLPGPTSEPQPLLPQTGGVSWLLLVILALAALTVVGMVWSRSSSR